MRYEVGKDSYKIGGLVTLEEAKKHCSSKRASYYENNKLVRWDGYYKVIE